MPTDNLGVWDSLGSVTVNEQWQVFPGDPILSQIETFRLTYSLNWNDWINLNGRQSFGLIRLYYYENSGAVVGTSQRIYPKQEREIRVFPYPPGISVSVVWTAGVKRILSKKRVNVDSTQEVIPWTLSLEYLT